MLTLLLRILLFFGFALVITPLGLLLRLFGVDYLRRSIDRNRDSYWTDAP